MPVYGDLGTMSLSDVLQWIGVTRKTGVLELQRGGARRRIEFSKGTIGACHSDATDDRLGRLLIDRGLITPEQLDAALVEQELGGKRLAFILVEQGHLGEGDARKLLVAHLEQSIQDLFRWDDAVFRFYEGASFDPVRVEVALSVDDVLLKTLQFQDELDRIRAVFPSSAAVLGRRDSHVPEELSDAGMSRRIFESLDGRRTIGEVVARSRASEILVLKLLHRLAERGLVEVTEAGAAAPDSRSLLDPLPPPNGPQGSNFELQQLGRRPGVGRASPESGVATELAAARQLVERDEVGVALDLLDAVERADPANPQVVRLRGEIATSRPDLAGDSRLPLSHIPVLANGEGRETLDSEESFLLSLVDGACDVRAIVGLAALREAEVLGTLELLLDKGCITLREPECGEDRQPA